MPLSRSALAAVFRRSGSPGAHTMIFEDADPFIRKVLQLELERRRTHDTPVIVTFFSPQHWSVITTDGLLACDSSAVRFVAAHDVQKVSPVRFEGGRPLPKTEMNTLRVSVRDGTEVDVKTDPGATFSGLWNVLKAFEAQSSKSAGSS